MTSSDQDPVAGAAVESDGSTHRPVITQRQFRFIIIGLMLGMLSATMSMTIVSPAMPVIMSELGGFEQYSWVIVSAMLASAVSSPIFGKLSDLYGRRILYALGLGLFMIGSVISGLAQNTVMLIAARAIQGLGMGGVMPLAQAIIGDVISPRERGKYMGMMGGVFGLASIAGPLAGGWITDNLSWRWLFFINLPIGLAALLFVLLYMHVPVLRRAHKIDVLGIITLTAALTTGLLATTWGGVQYPWSSREIVGLYSVCALSLALFIWAESRASEPIIPLSLWKNRTFASASVASLFVAGGMFGAIFFVPVFLQGVMGESVTGSGTLLIPMMLAMVGSSIAAGFFITKTGRYKALTVAGTLVMGLGFYLLGQLGVDATRGDLVFDVVVIGLGLGVGIQTYTLVVQNAVEHEVMGTATSANQLFRNLGGTLGVAILGTVMLQQLKSSALGSLPSGSGGPAASGGRGMGSLLNPEVMAQLPPPVLDRIHEALASSLQTVFLSTLPLIAIAFLATLVIPALPLKRTARVSVRKADSDPSLEVGSATAAEESA